MFNLTNHIALLHPESIALDSSVIEQASQNSLAIASDRQQWGVYLNGLAALGLQQWLQNRLPEHYLDTANSTLFQPGYAELIDSACNLMVKEFNICVIATESIFSDIVQISQATVELQPFIPHFYVMVEVIEEHYEVIFRGVLRRDRLVQYLQNNRLKPDQDWTYRVPLDLFERENNLLVTYTKHLNKTNLPMPVLVPEASLVAMTAVDLQQILNGLSPNSPLWQQLTWKQMASILMLPKRVKQLHHWQQKSSTNEGPQSLPGLESATQKILNIAQWMESGLDELAQSLGFLTGEQLLAFGGTRSATRGSTTTTSTRSLSGTFEDAIGYLRQGGLPIPGDARPVYRYIDELPDLELCLCLLPFEKQVSTDVQYSDGNDWSLLVIVGSQFQQYLPAGLQLQISCRDNLLENQRLGFEEALLYSSVDAKAGEALQVRITAPDRAFYELLKMTFDPKELSCQDG